jgi:hypothetical protein
MFTAEERDHVRERVFAIARDDERVTGGAVTGSHATGAEDRWSDVDTTFGLAAGVSAEQVLDDWTELIARELDVVHFFDLRRGSTIYRVFLLANSLEVDISLTPADEFRARGPSFQLIFGESAEQTRAPPADIDELIGWGWIYVLNARAAIERGKLWQAEYFIRGTRDHGLALACVRNGLPAAYARGVDRLDAEATRRWDETLVRSLEPNELRRALSIAADAFLEEVGETKPKLAESLREPLSLDAA